MTAPSKQGEELGIVPPSTPRGAGAVMSQRSEPRDSLDDFPTPPWATRALFEVVFRRLGLLNALADSIVLEPACGRDIMASVIAEYVFATVSADVHDYGVGAHVASFVGDGPDVLRKQDAAWDAIISNPPFRLAVEFFERAIEEAEIVAFLVRSNWAEGGERFERIFSKHPPLCVAQFAERVPMVRGRWDPEASTATAYAWFVWLRGSSVPTQLMWIPPGQRQALTKPDDAARFASPSGYKSEAAR